MVRRATEDDLVTVARLSQRWASEENTHGLVASDTQAFLPNLGDYFYVAVEDSRIVGYIVGSVHQSDGMAVIPKDQQYLEVDEVYVHPEWRREGIGHEMVDTILSAAESQGITRTLVYSASKQWEQIVGFYQQHGFKMWFVQMYK